MAELVRKIEEADLPKLKDLMTLVFGNGDWTDIEHLGGMTNHSYKITRADGQEYLVRIPGDGTDEKTSFIGGVCKKYGTVFQEICVRRGPLGMQVTESHFHI